MTVQFCVLGPVEVSGAEVTGAKQRLLLALLLVEPGRRVSRDRLAGALWPERPPLDLAHALDVQVSRLRKALGADRVVTADGGYRLELDAGDEVDARRFAALVAGARELPADRAADRLQEALGLWRGRAFGGLADEPALRAAAAALDDARVAAQEARFEAELALGHHEQVAAEVAALAADQPLRERPHEQLMLALYRQGRQAEALQVYDGLRRRLAEELGIAPGESARRLHASIVRQDPRLSSAAPPSGRTPAASRSRRLLGAVAAGAVTALAVAVVTLAGGDGVPEPTGRSPLTIDGRRLAFVDLRRNEVVATVPLEQELAGEAVSFARGDGADWLGTGAGTVLRIDPEGHHVERSSALGFPLGAIATGLGGVWVVAADRPLVARLDPVYGAVRDRFRLPRGGVRRPERLTGVAVGAGSVWVAQGEQRVVRLDPRTGAVLARIPAPGATSLAPGGDAVWVAGGDRGRVYRIDAATNTVTASVPLDAYVCCVATGGGYAWALNHRVWKLARDGRVISSIPIDGDGANLAWSGGAMWVSEGTSGRYTRIDPRTDATRSLRTHGLALLVGVRGGIAMLVSGNPPPDLLAGVRGPVARIELQTDVLKPDDPALASPGTLPLWREQLLDATCARLLALRPAPAPQGWAVAPEVAELPASADGRLWRLRIRSGLRFSPPSGAAVTAASMRATLERALSPAMGAGAPGPGLLADVVGLRAFRAGEARHVRGLRARGDELVVRLRRPARDLPLRLTARAFCAVPAGSPPSPVRFAEAPLPAAGPYYVAGHLGGVSAVLRRNPNYRGPRRGRFAAFLYEQAVQVPAAVDRVERGRADLVTVGVDAAAPTPAGAVARALPATHLLRVDVADGRVRRAVALALDRRRLAAAFGDLPTGHVLPPGVAGSIPVAVPAADAARARALLAGRRVRLVLGGCRSGAACRAFGVHVREALAPVGIDVAVRPRARTPELRFLRADLAAPDPLGFLARAAGAAPREPRPAPAEAAVHARRLDARLTRSARVVAFGTPIVSELSSGRLGCRRTLPLSFGDDLTALCPR